MDSSDVDWKPKIGMGFDSMEEANKFWLAYSFRVGFGIRVRFENKKEDDSVSSCRLVCCKEGLKRKEKRYAYEGKYTRADNGDNGGRPEIVSSDVMQAKGFRGTTRFKAN